MKLFDAVSEAGRLDLPNNPKYQRVGPGPVRDARPGLHGGVLPPLRVHAAPPVDPEPPLSPHLLCPMPGVTVAPDSLRQFYRNGIPQMRVLPPRPL